MTNAVIQGSYADIKTVKTRGCFQVVVEVPIEQYASFVSMFGGPMPGEERPVALALLQSKPENRAMVPVEGPHPLVQKAGILCTDKNFHKWIAPDVASPNEATAITRVRMWCGIQSRKELATNPEAAAKFEKLVQRYYEAQR